MNIHEMEQKLNLLKQNVDFVDFCKHMRKIHNFDEMLEVSTKIAKIDKSKYSYDDSLLHLNPPFNEEEIKQNILEFYTWLDSFTPKQEKLAKVAKKHMKYFIIKQVQPGKGARSYCSVGKPDGQDPKFREIGLYFEGRVGDSIVADHEFAHSMSNDFRKMDNPYKDQLMKEVCTVICDSLSTEFMIRQFPDLTENLLENAKFSQILNVKKAREVVTDAIIIKLVLGEITIQDFVQNYGSIYDVGDDIIGGRIYKLEHEMNKYKEESMYEFRYLYPQAIASVFMEEFQKNPQLAIEKFKNILSRDTELTIDEVIKMFNIESRKELINNFVDNYQTRIAAVENKKQNYIQTEKD